MIALILPLPPNAANSRRHWRLALKQKQAYWASLNVLAAGFYKPPAPLDPARISAHLFVWNPMDDDNAMHRMKVILDWLKGPYIVDDSRKHLVWEGMPEQTIDRKHPRVLVRLFEMDEVW